MTLAGLLDGTRAGERIGGTTVAVGKVGVTTGATKNRCVGRRSGVTKTTQQGDAADTQRIIICASELSGTAGWHREGVGHAP